MILDTTPRSALYRMFRPPSSYSMLRLQRVIEVLREEDDYRDLPSLRDQALKTLSVGERPSRVNAVRDLRSALDEMRELAKEARKPMSPDQRDASEFLDVTAGHTYFVRTSYDGSIKIGTSIALENRMHSLHYHAGDKVSLILAVPGGRLREKSLHKRFRSIHIGREWFEPTPELCAYIDALAKKERS